mmetsp:Transcript_81349/g.235906  ORF Transcript_81349/g.235906 Transcript_81349/m.235906 type:complete len:277 (+) Transcript_81349:1983-2813(+)
MRRQFRLLLGCGQNASRIPTLNMGPLATEFRCLVIPGSLLTLLDLDPWIDLVEVADIYREELDVTHVDAKLALFNLPETRWHPRDAHHDLAEADHVLRRVRGSAVPAGFAGRHTPDVVSDRRRVCAAARHDVGAQACDEDIAQLALTWPVGPHLEAQAVVVQGLHAVRIWRRQRAAKCFARAIGHGAADALRQARHWRHMIRLLGSLRLVVGVDAEQGVGFVCDAASGGADKRKEELVQRELLCVCIVDVAVEAAQWAAAVLVLHWVRSAKHPLHH